MAEKSTINQKIAKLDADVEWFYGEDFSLEQASDKYKAAIKLAKDIEKDLAELKNQIEVIDKDFTKE
ncbi:exodeoxyribonuclease VII small subunit [Candidatus Saccharibacteria bacterium]|nr:exodeoxyribonuclease VII small subunit [Candidatus Saccharibacteria bacterium]